MSVSSCSLGQPSCNHSSSVLCNTVRLDWSRSITEQTTPVTAVLQMLMSLLMNQGDTIMCEEFTYPHMIESFVIPKGFKVQEITTDDQGIVPEVLSKVLEARSVQGQKAPRLLYTVPVGQNPTGNTPLIWTGILDVCIYLSAHCQESSVGTHCCSFPLLLIDTTQTQPY